MGRGRRDYFEHAGIAQSAKRRKQIAIPIIHKTAAAISEEIDVELRERAQLLVAAVLRDLARGKIDRAFEVAHVTLSQQLVLQHRAKCGCDADRELEWHAV